MNTASDHYATTAMVYIDIVKRESLDAGAALEAILAEFGARAALRTALTIIVMKMEVQENNWLPPLSLYFHLLDQYPDALPLAEYAMGCCLQRWSKPRVGVDGLSRTAAAPNTSASV